MKTTLPKESDIARTWHLVDAADQPLGRLAVQIANLLRGRHKVDFAPHIDGGDFVVVINAAKVKLTGNKDEKKVYQRFTGFRSGRKLTTAAEMRGKHPERMIEKAVGGMLPDNNIARLHARRLKVYPGSEHPHAAQAPQPV